MGDGGRDCKRRLAPYRNIGDYTGSHDRLKHMTFKPLRAQTVQCLPHLRRFIALAALFMVMTLAAPGADAADEDGAPANVYMTGAEVRIDRPVDGDLTAAAGRIHVDQPVAGDAMLGAGSVDVQAPVGEDLRAAGGIVTIASRVQGTALVAAARIILTSAAEMRGETWLAGANVTLGGRAFSAVKVYAREVSVLGEIYGPLEISADRIDIHEGARIRGDITYSGASEIKIDPRAEVTGKVTRRPGKLEGREPAAQIPGLKPLRPLLIAALFAAGALLHLVFPRFMAKAVRTLEATPAKSLALGAALFFSVPPIAVLLVITIIGIPVALALIAAHAAALLIGYFITAFFIAGKLAGALNRPAADGWRRYALFAGALLLLALGTSIPYAGALIPVLACAGGLGATVLQRFGRHSELPRAVGTPDAWPAA
ncbi:MAG: hypothetical protein QOK44_4847 [Betaproteobacteria bacterium]|nr:hypothetical protein [Betaproteobacteria bacterium]